jgi:hypothetical protein
MFWPPSAQTKTIRALSASACAVLRRVVTAFSSARSSSLSLKGASCRTAISWAAALAAVLMTID